ncbi:MAG: GGDEF domain-containing protein [Xanthomonadales bacterium]|nr:GGDEF domain-containing protein [Xanthomonadales bacterium]
MSSLADDRTASGLSPDQLIELLRNGIVRISHAASGIDDELDGRLSKLRKMLRSDPKPAVVEHLISDVSKAVVSMDARNRAEEKHHKASAERLLEVFDLFQPSWQLRRKKKAVAAKLKSKNAGFTVFLREYSDLLNSAVREKAGGAKPEQGVITRMLGSKSSGEEVEIPDPDTTEAIEEIRRSLTILLNHVDTDEDLSQIAGGIRKRLDQQLDAAVLPEIIESIADLADTSKNLERKRFEDFVQKMAEQFDNLERAIQSSAKIESETRESRAEMEQALRTTAKNLKSQIVKSTNLGQLQRAVATEVEDMTQTLEKYHNVEEIRHKKFEASIDLLQAKLGETNAECNELYAEIQQLRIKSQLDALTGLPNRAGFMERAQQEYERALRYGNRLSVALVDIDNFKKVNDRYGHQAGDTVITEVGSVIAGCLRKSDFVCRYGGEEFVILLPETPLDKAFQVAEKIRQAVSKTPFAFRERRVQVTVSVGVSELESNQSISELVEKADVALYGAKSSGRNRAMTSAAH